MKKNETMQMNNGSVMMNNGSMMMRNGGMMMRNSGMMGADMAGIILGTIAKNVDKVKENFGIIMQCVASFYSKELEMEVTPAKAWALIKAQIAFGCVLLTASYIPLFIASLVWFGSICLKMKNEE